MSGGFFVRIGVGLVAGWTLLGCNTFDPPADDDSFGFDPGAPPPSAGFFGGAAGSPADATAGVPALPPPVLQVLKRTPAPDATGVDVNTEVQITFSLPISPNKRKAAKLVQPDGFEVPCFEVVDGATLRLQPTQRLELNTRYRVELSMFVLLFDNASNLQVSPAEQSWSFTTRAADEMHDLGAPLARAVYHEGLHRLWGVDASQPRLVSFDLATKLPGPQQPLPASPADLCITPDGQRVFVVYREADFFTEHDAKTLERLRMIDWPQKRYDTPETLPHVRCTNAQALLVDQQWEPSLWTFAFDAAAPVDQTMRVHGIGDLVPTSDGEEFYFWWQFGWNAGNAGTDVRRVALMDLLQLDTTEIGYPKFLRDPLDAPILLDEARGRVFTKNLVIDSGDLMTIHFEFPAGEVIYALDPKNQRAASRRTVYALESRAPIDDTLSERATAQFFDRDGVLYFVVDDDLLVQRFQ